MASDRYQNLNKRVGKMKRPNLQIALDHNSLEDALADCMKVGEIVDIIEVGTILCLQEAKSNSLFKTHVS